MWTDGWVLPIIPWISKRIRSATGMTIDPDFMQGQAWKILSGGGYYRPYRTFIDEMWAAYRNSSAPSSPANLRIIQKSP